MFVVDKGGKKRTVQNFLCKVLHFESEGTRIFLHFFLVVLQLHFRTSPPYKPLSSFFYNYHSQHLFFFLTPLKTYVTEHSSSPQKTFSNIITINGFFFHQVFQNVCKREEGERVYV